MPRLSPCTKLQFPARRPCPLAVALLPVLACMQANASEATDGKLLPVQLGAVQEKADDAARKA